MSPVVVAADSVSVKAVYRPSRPVLSSFTEPGEGTAATTNTETLPTPRQLQCCTNKGHAVCVCVCVEGL